MRGVNQSYENLILCFEDGLAVMVINRPKALNALNSSLIDQMSKALDEIEADKKNRVLLVTGSGDKAFVAGADISQLKGLNQRQGQNASKKGQKLFDRIENSRLFSIAAVNGFALGGGLELAMACDMRVASNNATVGLPEVGLGIIPGYGGTQRLPRLVGKGRALELIATGRKIDAGHAWRIGLVNHVVPPEQLLDTCRGIAREVLAAAPLAVEAAKNCVNKGLTKGQAEGQKSESREFGLLCLTDDVSEGMGAFLEKRRPVFQGS
ncbi:MAG: enoyl-CoA hydratase/isomerase family protein [Candidatus Eremiobacteraeota bacterium]|nr:enoyl-CoA hydratase/isomerase family protein [Candidatus Eremiobacteraeota bacterium]